MYAIHNVTLPMFNQNAEERDQTLELIPGLQGIKINDLPNEVLMDNQESPLAHMVYNMALNLQRATAVVINSFEETDPAITTDLKSKPLDEMVALAEALEAIKVPISVVIEGPC